MMLGVTLLATYILYRLTNKIKAGVEGRKVKYKRLLTLAFLPLIDWIHWMLPKIKEKYFKHSQVLVLRVINHSGRMLISVVENFHLLDKIIYNYI